MATTIQTHDDVVRMVHAILYDPYREDRFLCRGEDGRYYTEAIVRTMAEIRANPHRRPRRLITYNLNTTLDTAEEIVADLDRRLEAWATDPEGWADRLYGDGPTYLPGTHVTLHGRSGDLK
jgi:hypothetical protein